MSGPAGHIVPIKIYVAVYVILLLLTGFTVAVAYQDFDLGVVPLNLGIAMTIATFKAVLVILFFMHVKYSQHLVKVFVAAGFLWLLVMLSITLSDYMTRTWISQPRGW